TIGTPALRKMSETSGSTSAKSLPTPGSINKKSKPESSNCSLQPSSNTEVCGATPSNIDSGPTWATRKCGYGTVCLTAVDGPSEPRDPIKDNDSGTSGSGTLDNALTNPLTKPPTRHGRRRKSTTTCPTRKNRLLFNLRNATSARTARPSNSTTRASTAAGR